VLDRCRHNAAHQIADRPIFFLSPSRQSRPYVGLNHEAELLPSRFLLRFAHHATPQCGEKLMRSESFRNVRRPKFLPPWQKVKVQQNRRQECGGGLRARAKTETFSSARRVALHWRIELSGVVGEKGIAAPIERAGRTVTNGPRPAKTRPPVSLSH
jgi:hypothetical protein